MVWIVAFILIYVAGFIGMVSMLVDAIIIIGSLYLSSS